MTAVRTILLSCALALGLAAPVMARPPAALQGSWIGLLHCSGTDHELRFDIDGDGGLSVSGGSSGNIGRTAMAWPQQGWQLSHEAGGERLLLRNSAGPAGRHGLSVQALLAPQAWVGELLGRGWEACSPLLVLRPAAAARLAAELPDPPGARRGRAGPLDRLRERLSRRERCDPEALRWLDRYLARMAALSAANARTGASAQRREMLAMYEDAEFRAAFGKRFAEMDDAEANQLAQVLQGSYRCPELTPERQAQANRQLMALLPPLRDSPHFSRRLVALELAARPHVAAWAQGLQARIDGWARSEPARLDAAAIDGAAASVSAFAELAALPDAGAPLLAQLRRLREQAASVQASQLVQTQAAQVPAELGALLRLAQQLRARPGGAAVDGAARQAVAERVDALLPGAARDWAARAQGLSGWRALAGWRQSHAELLVLAGAPAQAAAQAALDERQASLASELLAGWRQDFARQVATQPPGLAALAAGTALELRLRDETAALAALPALQAFSAERATRRTLDLQAAAPALVAQARQAPHLSALQALRERHLLPEDADSATAQALQAAFSARQAQIAPFAGLPAADYLNALYGEDVERLQALDRAFREPYKAMLLPTLQQTAPLMNLFSRIGGVQMDYAALMTRSLDSISLIAPLFAVYLIEFEGRLGPCLERDALRFKITRSSETVYKDGWGNYKYSVQHPDQVEHFRVNRRFGPVFEQVGLSNPQSVLGNMLDGVFKSGGRVGIGELVQGTRAMMDRFDREGCNAPLMRRMETAMLSYFARYRQAERELLDATLQPAR